MSDLVIFDEDKQETREQKRRRLATEMRLVVQQYNSKLAECIDAGLTIDITHRGNVDVRDEEAIIDKVDPSFQTPRKYYV